MKQSALKADYYLFLFSMIIYVKLFLFINYFIDMFDLNKNININSETLSQIHVAEISLNCYSN